MRPVILPPVTDPALFSSLLDVLPSPIAEIGLDGTLFSGHRLPSAPSLYPLLADPEPLKAALAKGDTGLHSVQPLFFLAEPAVAYEARFRGVDGNPDRRILLFHPIPPSSNATLEHTEERLRFAAEATGMGLWNWDARSDKIEWDQALCRLYGRSSGPESYAAYMECIYPDDRAKVQDSLEHAIRTGVYDDLEHRILLPDGRIRWLYAKAKVVKAPDGSLHGMLGGAIDVSARKTLEEQLRQAQKLEAVGQLTSGIAHNFNNILTGILPCAQLIAMEAPESLLPLARDIEYSARRAAELVRQLVTFTRQSQPQKRQPELLSAMLGRTAAICRNTFPPSIRITESLPAQNLSVLAASGQIEQVLLNLMLNARDAVQGVEIPTIELILDYLPADSPELSFLPPGTRKAHLRLNVRDNGHGMDDITRRRVFEPFFTTKPPGRGTGLGLAVTYAIIQDHQGHVTCQSQPEKGTTFSVYLPACNELPSAAQPDLEAPRGEGQHILLVDDEETIRRVVCSILENAGYRVSCCGDGREALTWLQRHGPVDLVLLDLSMPHLSGSATLPHLHKAGLKVALLTGQPTTEIERGDVAAILEKPVERATLLNVVHRLVQPTAPRAARRKA